MQIPQLEPLIQKFIDRHDNNPSNGVAEDISKDEITSAFIDDFIATFSPVIDHPKTLHEIGRTISDHLDWEGSKRFIQLLFSSCPRSFNSIVCEMQTGEPTTTPIPPAYLDGRDVFDVALLAGGAKDWIMPSPNLAEFAKIYSAAVFYHPQDEHLFSRELYRGNDESAFDTPTPRPKKLTNEQMRGLADDFAHAIPLQLPLPEPSLHDVSRAITKEKDPDIYEAVVRSVEELDSVDPIKAAKLLSMLTDCRIRVLDESSNKTGKFAYTNVFDNHPEIYFSQDLIGCTYGEYLKLKESGSPRGVPFQSGRYASEIPLPDMQSPIMTAILSHELTHVDQLENSGADMSRGYCRIREKRIHGFRYDKLISQLFVKEDPLMRRVEDITYRMGIEGLLGGYLETRAEMEADAETRAYVDVLLMNTPVNHLHYDTVLSAIFCFPNQWPNFYRELAWSDLPESNENGDLKNRK